MGSKTTPRQTAAPRPAQVPSVVHDAQVSSQINLAARLTNQAARIRLGELGAWPGQIPILLWLLEEDGIIQKELVARANVEQSTIAEHLDRMERDGLLVRKRGDTDRRMYRIYLTPKARKMSAQLLLHLESGARAFTQGIPQKDLAVFDRVIRKIIENLDAFVHQSAEAKPRAKPARRPRKPA